MRRIVVVGTLHAGATPNRELGEVLEQYAPDQVLVEIAQSDIGAGKLRSYPPEMRFAYRWAVRNRVNVHGFDHRINLLARGKTQKDNLRLIEKEKKLLGDFTWKDMNRERNLKKLDTDDWMKLVDWGKMRRRDREMARNVKRRMLRQGTVLIITGCGNLHVFEKHLKGAIFPFH